MTDFDPVTVAAAVAAQAGLAAGLFDVLRADSLDEPGVTRDPYGPGEQRAHAGLEAGVDPPRLALARHLGRTAVSARLLRSRNRQSARAKNPRSPET